VIGITLSNLWARKFRLLATSVAVLVGVAFMSGTLVLSDTMGRTFDGLFTDAYAGTDVVVRGESAFADGDQFQFGATSRPRLDAELVERAEAVDGVAAAGAEVEGYAQLIGSDGDPIGDPMGAPTLGVVWPEHDQLNPMNLVEGRAPSGVDEVVIDRGSATTGDLSVGDVTSVLTAAGPVEVTVVGVATWGEVDSPLGASISAFDLASAQELIGEPGKVDAISIVAEDGISQDQLRDRVAGVVPEGVEVATGADVTAEGQAEVRDALGFFNTFLLVFALIALFVGSFIIYNTFSILVAQRSREMALMRAVGASRAQVLGATLIEAAVIGLIASVLGMVAGIGVAGLLKGLLAAVGLEIPAGGTVVTANTVVAALAAGLLVSLAAAIVPARRASLVAPMEALSAAEVEQPTRSGARTLAGITCTAVGAGLIVVGLFAEVDNAVAVVGLGAALTFLGVAVLGPLLARPAARFLGAPLPKLRGVAGTIARQNAIRNPRRTASTAAALMIGVALVGFITIFAESARASIRATIGESFRGDFVVDSGSFGVGGFNPDLSDDLAALAEVEAASPIRLAPAEVGGELTFLVGVDPVAVDRIFDVGIRSGSLDALDAGSIAVHDDLADAEGIELGDTMDVRFVETGDQQLTVAGTFANRDLVGGDYALSIEAFDEFVPGQLDMSIFVAAAEGVAPAAARAAIEEATAAYPTATVLDLTEFQDDQVASFDPILGLVYVLLTLAVLVALLGIANTLALSIHERTRELGLLRAVGMSRRQVRSSVRWEAVIIAVFGSLLGLVIGLFFGWVMVEAARDTGFSQFRVPVAQLAVITVLAALAGVVAAVVPARRAARLDVLDALAGG
jgi:putative ABC transport system permease protein